MGQNKVVKLIVLALLIMIAGMSDSYGGDFSDFLLPSPKKINNRIKDDLSKVKRQFKSDMQKINCISEGDFQGVNNLMKNDVKNFKHEVKNEIRNTKRQIKHYKEKVKGRMLRDYQKFQKINDKVINKVADVSRVAHKPIAKGMDKLVSTQPKEVRKFYKKYPGTTTLLFTGDTTAASAVSDAKKFENPNLKSHGVDGILSTTYITHPGEHYSTQFLSGASGEKTDTNGMNNYIERIAVGSSVGAARGASVGKQYGGAWGAAGGAIGGAMNGAYLGSMTPEQSKHTIDRLCLGRSSDAENAAKYAGYVTGGIGGYDKAVPHINKHSPLNLKTSGTGITASPNGVADAKNANQAAWESGHEGNYVGEGSQALLPWYVSLPLRSTGANVKGAKGVHEAFGEVYEDTGVNFGRLIPRIGEKPYGN